MGVTAPLTSAWIGEPGTALVTGATGGIGAAVVRLLTEQGWSVVATDRDPTGGDRLPSGCRYVVGDITERDTHERFVAAATEIGDNRWALVHCAGASRAGNYLLEDPDSWEELRIRHGLLRQPCLLRGVRRGRWRQWPASHHEPGQRHLQLDQRHVGGSRAHRPQRGIYRGVMLA
jgi:NAD(P)-dependent dehydrogenase (short-subunit alcohol dehydrogenase family)